MLSTNQIVAEPESLGGGGEGKIVHKFKKIKNLCNKIENKYNILLIIPKNWEKINKIDFEIYIVNLIRKFSIFFH